MQKEYINKSLAPAVEPSTHHNQSTPTLRNSVKFVGAVSSVFGLIGGGVFTSTFNSATAGVVPFISGAAAGFSVGAAVSLGGLGAYRINQSFRARRKVKARLAKIKKDNVLLPSSSNSPNPKDKSNNIEEVDQLVTQDAHSENETSPLINGTLPPTTEPSVSNHPSSTATESPLVTSIPSPVILNSPILSEKDDFDLSTDDESSDREEDDKEMSMMHDATPTEPNVSLLAEELSDDSGESENDLAGHSASSDEEQLSEESDDPEDDLASVDNSDTSLLGKRNRREQATRDQNNQIVNRYPNRLSADICILANYINRDADGYDTDTEASSESLRARKYRKK